MKKQILLTTLLITSLSFTLFGQKFSTPTSGEYTVKNCAICKPDYGTVAFTIVVKHKKEEKALDKAIPAAVEAVLVRGIPGSAVSSPLLTAAQLEKNRKAIDELIHSESGIGFVSKTTIDPLNTFKLRNGPFRGGYEVAVDVEVQYQNLKKYLVQKGIITLGL